MSNAIDYAVTNQFSIMDGEEVLATSNVATSTLKSSKTLLAVKSQSHVVWGGAGQAQVQEYGCAVTNLDITPKSLQFKDVLSQYIKFKDGSFTVNGTAATPVYTVATNTLTYDLGSVAAGATVNIQFQVLPAM